MKRKGEICHKVTGFSATCIHQMSFFILSTIMSKMKQLCTNRLFMVYGNPIKAKSQSKSAFWTGNAVLRSGIIKL